MKSVRCEDFLRLLPEKTNVRIRGAFQSGYGKDEDRPIYYSGLISNLPVDFKYKDYEVYCSFWWGEKGDVCDISEAHAVDIALTDFGVE